MRQRESDINGNRCSETISQNGVKAKACDEAKTVPISVSMLNTNYSKHQRTTAIVTKYLNYHQ